MEPVECAAHDGHFAFDAAVKLHFASIGSGRPLVILHGLLGSLNNWQTIARSLSGSFQVFALDQRNHGRSPHSPEFSYAAMAADLLEFMDDQALPSAALLGHSMGGKTAMEFAIRHPGRTSALVVADIGPRAYPRGHDAILDAMAGIDLARYHSRESIDAALALAIPELRVRQFVLTNLKRHQGGTYTWKVNLAVLRERNEEVTRGIEIAGTYSGPVLFLTGENSGYLSEADMPEIRNRFPSATLRTIAGAGHWIHADAPAEFISAVISFLQQ